MAVAEPEELRWLGLDESPTPSSYQEELSYSDSLDQLLRLRRFMTEEEKEEIDTILYDMSGDFFKSGGTFTQFLCAYVNIVVTEEEAEDGQELDYGGESIKFEPWLWQIEMANILPKLKRSIWLKGRQLGVTWIVAAYALYVAMKHKDTTVLLLSINEDEAGIFLDKIGYIYEHLPEPMQARGRKAYKKTEKYIRFFDRNSRIDALPTTKRAGRSRTARLVVCDEHAFHEYAEANLAATKPTAEAGGQVMLVSTADGVGNTFANLWFKFTDDKGRQPFSPHQREDGEWTFGGVDLSGFKKKEWIPFFLPFNVRPGRDAQWWQDEFESSEKPWQTYSEYPRDANEAFVQSGLPVFQAIYLELHKAECSPPLPRSEWPSACLQDEVDDPEWPKINCGKWLGGELKIWRPPDVGRLYVGAGDPA